MIDVLGSLEPHLGDERALALDATNIACAVEDFMTKKGLLFYALCGIGTEGVPVLNGKKGGAVKLIEKQKAPSPLELLRELLELRGSLC